MTAPANTPRPTSLPGGATTDAPYGPLANIGVLNPFFYHKDEDDFNSFATGAWTTTSGSTGSVALSAGDGGRLLFTTAATSSDYESIQRAVANFTLPQGALAGKRAAFLTRLQLSDITNSAFVAGLCVADTTPFTAISDGLYFSKVSGGTVLNLISVVGSVATTYAVPTAAYSFVNATNIDLAWEITRNGNVQVYVGSQLVGWIPQSGTGALNSSNYPALPVAGPIGRMTGLTLTTANLSLTLGLQAGAAAVKTMTVDFVGAWKER